MYTTSDLIKYDYFKNVDIRYALDSLTGVLSREYIIGFAKHLIENEVPFSMGILDVDNFKIINDSHGHDYGDKCLVDIVGNLAEFFKKNNGIVGRYGGDEFVFVFFSDTKYETVRSILVKLLKDRTILRRDFLYNDINHWVSATIGCSSFPKDATTYNQLFSNIDKTLYYGKSKGRNCFVIYDQNKYGNIDIHKKETSSIQITFNSLNRLFYNHTDKPDKIIQRALNYLIDVLDFDKAIFIKEDGTMISNSSIDSTHLKAKDLSFIKDYFRNDEIYIKHNIKRARLDDKNLSNLFEKTQARTFVASKIKNKTGILGHLVLLESKNERIWQEKDVAIIMYLDKLIQLLYLQS